MALIDKLTAIGDAIREKTSTTAPILLDNMPARIRSITTTPIDTTGIDQGVIDEANRVANSILPKIKSNSITFIAMSDMHEMGDSDNSSQDIINTYRLANKHAGQGAKLIAQQVPLDFFVNLGDLAWAEYKNNKTTAYDLFTSVEAAKSYLDIRNMVETIMLPGNHDSGLNLVDAFGNLISDDYTMVSIGNYRYIDFENKKVRVIALNTAERANTDASASVGNLSNAQLAWFANALNLSSKSDAANWKIIILSHHPFGNAFIPSATNVLEAYVNGSSITIDSTTYNFNGKNSAKVIGNFHGHTHCFKVANITGTNEIPVQRIAIPNACNGRNNEYGRDSKNYEYGETTTCPTIMVNNELKQQARKSTIAGQDTAFCVITIDLDKKIIYADCFGSLGSSVEGNAYAGYDRTISYGVEEVVTYNITNNLNNASTSNTTGSIVSGDGYIATITANDGFELDSIIVTMNGEDISSSAIINGNIVKIDKVTGNVVITVTTIKVTPCSVSYQLTNVSSSNKSTETTSNASYKATLTADDGYSINFVRVFMDGIDITSSVYNNGNINIESVNGDIEIIAGYYNNLVPTSQEANSESPYNSVGYQNGVYCSSEGGESGDTSFVSTGYIPYSWKPENIIYVRGAKITTASHVRIYGYYNKGEVPSSSTMCSGSNLATYFTMEELEAGTYYKLTPKATKSTSYIRLSLVGTGEKLIVTVKEPIATNSGTDTPITHSISKYLTNVSSSNEVSTVSDGESYTTTLTVNSGYTLTGGTVKVTMGGTDITASAYSNGKVTISSVTGNIVITATAVAEQTTPSYTNLVPTLADLADPNNGTVYNGVGYYNGAYLTTTKGSAAPYYKNTNGTTHVVTGFIPYTANTQKPIYVKGVTYDSSSSYSRMGYHDTNYEGVRSTPKFSEANFTNCFSVETLNSDNTYFKIVPKDASTINSKFPRMSHIAFSFKGTGNNMIITLDEPIE